MKSTSNVLPQLDAPGAGLPWPELFVARLMFAFARATRTREKSTTLFLQERERIESLVGNCTEETASRRVLVKRIAGMEDSSRYWSVWMTLEHLRIVHVNVAGIIQLLGTGIVPDKVASTAAVKPQPDIDAGVLPAFLESCDSVVKEAAKIPNLNTAAKFAHPWFGPLNAAGWYTLAPFHLRLHRRQIEAILTQR
jgi:hypothetical protein